MKLLRLIRIDFDNMENRHAERRKVVASFIDGDGESAYSKLERFLRTVESSRPYLGWDLNVYPMFTVEQETPQ